ncbi:MAG: DUF5343 domain-containing protein [Nitrososphaerota archaeon]|nr:DUF5343 domain-containing protein [Nitrososphaerota archaeon]
MAENPPYVMAYGKLSSLFAKIIEASPPPKFNRDFVNTVLGFKSSSDQAYPPFLKRLGFIDDANVPTQDYKDYREGGTLAKTIMAKRIRASYPTIFQAKEYAWRLNKQELTATVKRVHGLADESQALEAIVGTFSALCGLADFEAEPTKKEAKVKEPEEPKEAASSPARLGLSYTVVLNLPATTDIEVFNAIFKSLKENILNE